MFEQIPFAYWLRRRYASWRYGPMGIRQFLHPERRISVFSRWLDIDLDLLVGWMSGDQPDPDSTQFKSLVDKLGLPAYDCLGVPRPRKESLFTRRKEGSLPLTQKLAPWQDTYTH